MEKNIILVGLGPHAKRIYISLMKKYNILPKVIVDLDSNKDNVKKYLSEENILCDTYFVSNKEANNDELSSDVKKKIKNLIIKNKVKYAIISTEPKAHFAYAKFFLDLDINILMDKPITSPQFVFKDVANSKKVIDEYNILKEKYEKKYHSINFTIQCQRRYHAGYNYVKNILSEIISKYNIPITYIDIYHSDGMWNMPNEFLSRENHPYKYGYGKLFHSGYHFIDLLIWLLECNNLSNKNVNNISISSSVFKPNDFFNTVDNEFYEKYLNTSEYKEIIEKKNLNDFGELDVHSMIDFKKDGYVITHCNLNLLQSGFSKRAWTKLPVDTYKSNGRVRHEHVNIQVGPIMNIQIHSYQSDEINKKNDILNYDVGSIDHFDIYIFRNNNLIGGKSFEKKSIKDLVNKNDFLGNNEKARENCFIEFINDQKGESDLLKHDKSIYLLSKVCESISLDKIINCSWGKR